MRSDASSVSEYLAALSAESRRALSAVRTVIKKNLPKGYAEVMQHGMIAYVVPLTLYPSGYLDKKDVPLPFVSLAAQKRHLALYLMNVYGDASLDRWFREAWSKTGKPLDMGKSCVRFSTADELALEVIGEAIARTPVQRYIDRYEEARGPTRG